MHKIFSFFFFYFLFGTAFSQIKYRNPIDFDLKLAGNFGELRNNHFHSGLDVKTDGMEGKNMLAIADGYVSRIKIQGGGYGKALYVTHADGKVSVYAHLSALNGKIAEYLYKAQVAAESFEIEIFPMPDELPVKMGDVLAFSGNTGGSSGPHLHFELRDEKTEYALNPEVFGFDIPDSKSPELQALYIYNLNDPLNKSFQNMPIYKKEGIYHAKNSLFTISGNVGVGFKAIDFNNTSDHTMGIYKATLIVNKDTIFQYVLNKFSFFDWRYINSFIDYEHYYKTKSRITKCFLDKNNQLDIYTYKKNSGILQLEQNKIYDCVLILEDVKGNSSKANFKIKGGEPLKTHSTAVSDSSYFLNSLRENQINFGQLQLTFPFNTLYEDLFLNFKKLPKTDKTLSEIYVIHQENVPLHKGVELKILLDESMKKHKEKLVIAPIGGDKLQQALISKTDDLYIIATAKNFGRYAVAVDSIKPYIQALNWPAKGVLGKQSVLSFTISDWLSGLKSYKAYINNQFFLMEYDQKTNRLFGFPQKNVKPGKNTFKLIVTDKAGNSQIFEKVFLK